MPTELWNDITIFVSDNCSTDDTMQIGKEYSSKPNIDIVYSRNESNLGMDGNFVTCFKSAKTKYVWLLGDDDIIIIEKVSFIVTKLKESEFGVLHLCQIKKDSEDYTSYKSDTEGFLNDIGIFITFISANIVNAKYVSEIDFQKYIGTFFTLIPLYLTAMIKETNNLMINFPIFEGGKDSKRNGGYGICTVFIENYLGIFREFVDKGMLSEALYNFEKETAFRFVTGYVVRNYIFKEESNFKLEDTWGILFQHYSKTKVILAMTRRVLGYLKMKVLNH